MKNMDELFCGIILSDNFLLALLSLPVAVVNLTILYSNVTNSRKVR